MVDIRIRQVKNGFLVYDSPIRRYEETTGEHVFNTTLDLFKYLEECFSQEVASEITP